MSNVFNQIKENIDRINIYYPKNEFVFQNDGSWKAPINGKIILEGSSSVASIPDYELNKVYTHYNQPFVGASYFIYALTYINGDENNCYITHNPRSETLSVSKGESINFKFAQNGSNYHAMYSINSNRFDNLDSFDGYDFQANTLTNFNCTPRVPEIDSEFVVGAKYRINCIPYLSRDKLNQSYLGDCEIQILGFERPPEMGARAKTTFKITNIFRQPSQEAPISQHIKIKYIEGTKSINEMEDIYNI